MVANVNMEFKNKSWFSTIYMIFYGCQKETIVVLMAEWRMQKKRRKGMMKHKGKALMAAAMAATLIIGGGMMPQMTAKAETM